MSIMEEVNLTVNTSMEEVEEASYVWNIPTSGTEVIDKLTSGDPVSPAKWLKIRGSRYEDHFRSSNSKVYRQYTGKFEPQYRSLLGIRRESPF